VAKAAAGALTGSVALLAESAHSIADTANQGTLLASLRLSERPADDRHPFGYARERYFWAFVAALVIFLTGAAFSAGLGAWELFWRDPREGTDLVLPLVILLASGVAEGVSLARAARHIRSEAARSGRTLVRELRRSADPTTRTVLVEDGAAVVGVVVALAGVLLAHWSGDARWEGYASLVIAAILASAAYWLASGARSLLLGESARPEQQRRIRRTIEREAAVERVVELLTAYQGPRDLLVAARVDLVADVPGDRIEEAATRIEADLRRAVPDVRQVFLDPTRGSDR
jgi:cation diffusion facilitator family transporter